MRNFELKHDGEKYDINELFEIVRILRGEGGCPWDRAQTHYSLIKPMIEESYEVVDAIEKKSDKKLTEELGDVLLQVVFHSLIAEENGEFCFLDVTDRNARKMLERHTHVFGDEKANTPSEGLANWENAKLKEKGFISLYEDLADIPENFPALIRAEKIAKKIAKFGESAESVDFSFLDNVNFSDEVCVGKLLYEICRRSEKAHTECELALKRESDRIIKSKENKSEN